MIAMFNFYVIFMNSIFTISYVSLALVTVWELTIKLNNTVGRIILSDTKSCRDRILVTNLLQLLLSSALLATVRLIQKCPYPGTDYVLGYLLMVLVKLLHFKRETFLPDLVGILSLTVTSLVCHQYNTRPASLLETASGLINTILFTLFPPLILTLILPLSLSAGLLFLLLLSVRQRNSKLMIIPFCLLLLLLLQISTRYQESSPTTDNRNGSSSDIFQFEDKLKRREIINVVGCENDPVKYLTLSPDTFHASEGQREPELLLPATERRELTVVSSLRRGGRCRVEALDMTGSDCVTKYLLTLLASLLPTLELVPRVRLTGPGFRCGDLVGSEIITRRGNQTDHFLEEEITFSQNSLSARLMSLLSNVKNSVFDQFL